MITQPSQDTKTNDIAAQAAQKLDGAKEQFSAVVKPSIDALQNSYSQVRDKMVKASDHTVEYVKAEPVKAMLIAAATGAVLMALLRPSRSSRERS
ncbi:MAG: hypothetical protein V4858_01125 [Pseudomonadota bacterium]